MMFTGYSSGDVERFNIQSGQHRCSYGDPAHKSAVRGLATDSINRLVVTGCSSGFLKFWPFKNAGELLLLISSLPYSEPQLQFMSLIVNFMNFQLVNRGQP